MARTQANVITSLDLAKRDEHPAGLEAGTLGLGDRGRGAPHVSGPPIEEDGLATRSVNCSETQLRHILLLTATPHKGDPTNFSLFLQLLDEDAYADVKSIREAMERRRAPFYLRRTKEAMVYFPERQPDGTWEAKKIFTKRIPHTVDFHIDGPEDELYREVTGFVKRNRTEQQQMRRRSPRPGGPLLDGVCTRGVWLRARSRFVARLRTGCKRLTEMLKKAQEIARVCAARPARIWRNWTRWRMANGSGWKTSSQPSPLAGIPNR